MIENIISNTKKANAPARLLRFGAVLLALSSLSTISASSASGAYVRRVEPFSGTAAAGSNFTFSMTLSADSSGTGITSVVGLTFGNN